LRYNSLGVCSSKRAALGEVEVKERGKK